MGDFQFVSLDGKLHSNLKEKIFIEDDFPFTIKLTEMLPLKCICLHVRKQLMIVTLQALLSLSEDRKFESSSCHDLYHF